MVAASVLLSLWLPYVVSLEGLSAHFQAIAGLLGGIYILFVSGYSLYNVLFRLWIRCT